MSSVTWTNSLEPDLSFKNIDRLTGAAREGFLPCEHYKSMATLIIGFRISPNEPSRLNNLLFLLGWLDHYYNDVFDILLVEQDSEPRFSPEAFKIRRAVRYEFIYNPEEYNRGWGYNVAVKYFCTNTKVVALMDTDVLPGDNFAAAIRDCYEERYKVISPYRNIYYSDEAEAQFVQAGMTVTGLADSSKIKNPVTITGGIVIFDKKTYLGLNGFEQYLGYGAEDRALDVTVLNHCNEAEILIAAKTYVHLHHPQSARSHAAKMNFAHLAENYRCSFDPSIKPEEYIHKNCSHAGKAATLELLLNRSQSFGDPDLYRKGVGLTANGQLAEIKPVEKEAIIFPPDFESLEGYAAKEVYAAPPCDTDELAKFYNAFKGKRCFVIGNGPSLNKHDLALIENEYTFGVNSFYYKTRETGFRPHFYVVEDSSVMKENLDEIVNYHAPFKFFPTIYKELHPKDPNVFFFKMNRGFYEKSSPNYAVPRFSTDASKELFCGQSVTYINLQLAYFMGFTEVYLIGMDFSYVIPASHSRKGDVLLSDTDDENHFHKDYFGKGKTWKDPKLERVGNNYRMAKLAYESVGRRIYNATIGGSLEIFDRVDYLSLFDNGESSTPATEIELRDNLFSEANKLFRARRYSDALVMYLNLEKAVPEFPGYREAAVNCYMKARQEKQPIQAELKRRVHELLG